MVDVNTRLLVSDYVNFRLQRQGLEWSGRPTMHEPGRISTTMRTLGEEFEQRYTEVFQQMCNQLHITPNTAYPTFMAIVNELFSDGVKWGRIVALFSFGGSLAVQCVEKEMPPLVDQIVDWITGYVENHLQSWIDEHGGWVSVDCLSATDHDMAVVPLKCAVRPECRVAFIHVLHPTFPIHGMTLSLPAAAAASAT